MRPKPIRLELIEVFRKAAGVLRTNGHFQSEYYDNTNPDRPPANCPVCPVGALSIVLTGHPVPPNDAAAPAKDSSTPRLLALALWTLSQGIFSNVVDEDPIERIADWADEAGRTAGEVASTFLRIAWEIEREQVHNAIVATGVKTSDGTQWDLAGMGVDGMPAYVVAGTPLDAPFTAGLAELVDVHGTVSARSAA